MLDNKENSRKNTRKYLGIIISINGINYFAPLSSPKKSDYDLNGEIKKSSSIILRMVKDYSSKPQLLGTIKLNNMIPIPDSEIIYYDLSKETNIKYKNLVIVTLSAVIAKPVVGIILVTNAEDKVTAYILGIVLAELVIFSGLYWSQMLRGKKFFDLSIWKYALSFNIPLIPHYLSNTILNSSDRIMIERMVGASEAGIYNLAYAISSIMIIFNNALTQTLEPWMYKKIKENKINDISGVAYPAFVFVAIVNLFLIAFAPEVVKIFAPASYYEAVEVIPPVAMSVFFMFFRVFFAVFEFYYKETKNIAIATVSGAILNVALNYICIGIWGYQAAGYTTLVCYMVYDVAHYIFMRKVCKKHLDGVKPYDLKIIVGISTGFMICGFAYLFSYQNVALRYGITVFIVLVLWIKREYVLSMVKQLLAIRKAKKK